MLSQTAEYALRAMVCLSLTPNELVPTSVLAEGTKVPAHYLAKVLQSLAASDLIVGRRGVGGGYKLAQPADQINLMDVINAVSPVQRIDTCPLGITDHGPDLCPLHKKVDQAAKSVIDIFSGASLADLISEPNTNTPLCDAHKRVELAISTRAKNDVPGPDAAP